MNDLFSIFFFLYYNKMAIATGIIIEGSTIVGEGVGLVEGLFTGGAGFGISHS
tara:strand:+ start:906 stop:1064 length:159 start_codon:yes stop_codon:yes gene_type:complete